MTRNGKKSRGRRETVGRWESPQAGKVQNLGGPGSLNIFFMLLYVFETVAFEKRLVLKFDTRSCNLCMKATILWLPYHINY